MNRPRPTSNWTSHEPTTAMKPNEEDVIRWIDRDLDEPGRQRLEAAAAADPALASLRADAGRIGVMLRATRPASQDVSGPELFMHQLARRLDAAGTAASLPAAAAVATTPRQEGSLMRWLAPMAAAAAVVLGGVLVGGHYNHRPPAGNTVLLSSYAPDPAVHGDARDVEDADAVVIVLDGLPPVADPAEIVGFEANDSRTGMARLGNSGRGGHQSWDRSDG